MIKIADDPNEQFEVVIGVCNVMGQPQHMELDIRIQRVVSQEEEEEYNGCDYHCQCYQCSLDGCIIYSETNAPTLPDATRNWLSSLTSSSLRSTTTTTSSSAVIAVTTRSNNSKKRRIVSSPPVLPVVSSSMAASTATNDGIVTNKQQHENITIKNTTGSNNADNIATSRMTMVRQNNSDHRDPDSTPHQPQPQPHDDDNDYGHIYRRPIRGTTQAMRLEGHTIGFSTLLRIITFNLAMANHLSVIDGNGNGNSYDGTTTTTKSNTNKKKIDTAFQLYEQLLNDDTNDDDDDYYNRSNCSRFNMIVPNNLCHLYRMVNNNPTEYQHCLQRLLSSIMVVVDRNKIATDNNNNSNNYYPNNNNYNNEECEDNDNEDESSLSLSWSRSWFASATLSSLTSTRRRSRQRRYNNTVVDLDGFLQNVSPLIIQEQLQCAAIA